MQPGLSLHGAVESRWLCEVLSDKRGTVVVSLKTCDVLCEQNKWNRVNEIKVSVAEIKLVFLMYTDRGTNKS